ncbi:MAG: NAD(P)H-dependent oxidoreductase [Kordiimonadaceae bacterium]|nr:NAD(P)H-dependent oxidoreductase [Kordiimonadaceae bacterium]
MQHGLKSILIVNGAENGPHSRGEYNHGLALAAAKTLEPHFHVTTTDIGAGYDVETEINKYKQADAVIYQYPVFWFMVPSTLKKYMDDVFSYGEFFSYTDGPYGSGGLMHGKKVLFSTTWNAPLDAFHDETAFFNGMAPNEAIFAMSKAHQYCGFQELPYFSCHDIVQNPKFDADKMRFIAHIEEVFTLNRSNIAA